MIFCSHHQSNRFMKESTPKHEDGVDMISNLPNDVLQKILSGIPSTEEVIQTSILSTRWRYLWTLVPFIDIDYTRGLDPEMELESNRFREFVYWVLLNKPLNLDSFRLWCADYYNMVTLRQWIHAAVMRKVKLLDLTFSPKEESEDVQIPHSLVTCDSLEVLKLCLMGYRLCLPKITGFWALRVLELNDVLLNEAHVKYFLETCPLLEDLSLLFCEANSLVISCPKLKNLRIENREAITDVETDEETEDDIMGLKIEICCPKLVFLNLTGSLAYQFSFENLHSLKKAVIHIKDFFDYSEPTFDFFDEISHVESLSISHYCVKQCYMPLIDEPISLPNLKTLELTVDVVNDIIPFLTCLPDLESLHLIFKKHAKPLPLLDRVLYYYGLDLLNLEDAETINMVTRHLKKVDFLEFDGGKSKLDVARALLEHANLLEEMVFYWVDETMFHERSMNTMKEVSNFHKASLAVRITGVLETDSI